MSDKNFKVKHGLSVSGSLIHTSGSNIGMGKIPKSEAKLDVSGSIFAEDKLVLSGSNQSSSIRLHSDDMMSVKPY